MFNYDNFLINPIIVYSNVAYQNVANLQQSDQIPLVLKKEILNGFVYLGNEENSCHTILPYHSTITV